MRRYPTQENAIGCEDSVFAFVFAPRMLHVRLVKLSPNWLNDYVTVASLAVAVAAAVV